MAKKDGAKARPRPGRFEVEQTMSTAEVAGYLEALAKGLREGAIVIGDEADGFRASIASDVDVDLEVEARSGKRKSRVGLTLGFRSVRPEVSAPEAGAVEAPRQGDQLQATIPDEMSF